MSQQSGLVPTVTPQFTVTVPPEPPSNKQLTILSDLAATPATRGQLVCQQLLVGDTRKRAEEEAAVVLLKAVANTQVLMAFGNSALDGVNQLSDQMLRERPMMEIPELHEAMAKLSLTMRGIGRKYDPSDENARKRYRVVKTGVLARFHFGKTLLEELLADIQPLQRLFDGITNLAVSKQNDLMSIIAYYDQYYLLNEREIDRLIYVIGVMEILRDMMANRASNISIGNANMGDRGGEQQAQILDLVGLLDNKIIAFKSRLWVAWAMAPMIRRMRANGVGLSGRIEQTIGITIPTMKNTIVAWLTLSEAERIMQFNKAVDETFNGVMTMFATAVGATVPAMAEALATPTLDPRTVAAWSKSIADQADGVVKALETGVQKRAELEQAMIEGKKVIDAATQKVNQAQLEHVLTAAQEAEAPEIAHSVLAQG